VVPPTGSSLWLAAPAGSRPLPGDQAAPRAADLAALRVRIALGRLIRDGDPDLARRGLRVPAAWLPRGWPVLWARAVRAG